MTEHDPRRAQAIALHAAGMKIGDIMKKVRAGDQTIRKWLREAGRTVKSEAIDTTPVIGVRAMACAVIEWAVYDAFTAVVHSPGTGKKNSNVNSIYPDDRAQARHFLTDARGEWAEAREIWCDAAGINPDALREAVLRQYGERFR